MREISFVHWCPFCGQKVERTLNIRNFIDEEIYKVRSRCYPLQYPADYKRLADALLSDCCKECRKEYEIERKKELELENERNK